MMKVREKAINKTDQVLIIRDREGHVFRAFAALTWPVVSC
jgi:hypothetical protein